jgi:hypothetical protein
VLCPYEKKYDGSIKADWGKIKQQGKGKIIFALALIFDREFNCSN